MSGDRERSGIFKFLYIVLSIVTFPIFAIIYILKHPLWVLFFILLALGVLVYFPMSDGVEISGVVDWYKKKYTDVRLEVVTKAVESGKASFVPKTIIEDVEKIKKNAEEEKEESLRVKGENYNDKIVRDDEFESVAVGIKKKKGFVKKEAVNKLDQEVKSLVEDAEKAGGLSALVKAATKKEENKEEMIEEVNNVLDRLDETGSSTETIEEVKEIENINVLDVMVDEAHTLDEEVKTEDNLDEDAKAEDDLAKEDDEAEDKEVLDAVLDIIDANDTLNNDRYSADNLEKADDNAVVFDELKKVDDAVEQAKKQDNELPDINNLVVDLPVVENKNSGDENKSLDGKLELF